jgi:hypothetical protein
MEIVAQLTRVIVACCITLTIAGCSAQRHQLQRAARYPTRPPMPAATPPTQAMPKDYFTIGSSMNEVASIMGTPSRVDNVLEAVWWHYGYSRIVFRQGGTRIAAESAKSSLTAIYQKLSSSGSRRDCRLYGQGTCLRKHASKDTRRSSVRNI